MGDDVIKTRIHIYTNSYVPNKKKKAEAYIFSFTFGYLQIEAVTVEMEDWMIPLSP